MEDDMRARGKQLGKNPDAALHASPTRSTTTMWARRPGPCPAGAPQCACGSSGTRADGWYLDLSPKGVLGAHLYTDRLPVQKILIKYQQYICKEEYLAEFILSA